MSKGNHILDIQSDMLILEKDFDKRLLKPFDCFDNLFAVTARDAVDVKIVGDHIGFYNVAGKDVGTNRDLFCSRDIINRGPILFDHQKLMEIGYLDPSFYPIGQDDTEIGLRAKKNGWITGYYGIDYESRNEWGSTRKSWKSSQILAASEQKNMKRIIELHSDIILQPKSGFERLIL